MSDVPEEIRPVSNSEFKKYSKEALQSCEKLVVSRQAQFGCSESLQQSELNLDDLNEELKVTTDPIKQASIRDQIGQQTIEKDHTLEQASQHRIDAQNHSRDVVRSIRNKHGYFGGNPADSIDNLNIPALDTEISNMMTEATDIVNERGIGYVAKLGNWLSDNGTKANAAWAGVIVGSIVLLQADSKLSIFNSAKDLGDAANKPGCMMRNLNTGEMLFKTSEECKVPVPVGSCGTGSESVGVFCSADFPPAPCPAMTTWCNASHCNFDPDPNNVYLPMCLDPDQLFACLTIVYTYRDMSLSTAKPSIVSTGVIVMAIIGMVLFIVYYVYRIITQAKLIRAAEAHLQTKQNVQPRRAQRPGSQISPAPRS